MAGLRAGKPAFQAHALVLLHRMQMVDHFEARLGRVAVHRGDRAQAHEFLIVFQKSADARNLGRRNLEGQLAAVELAAGDGVGVKGLHGKSQSLFAQWIGQHSSGYRLRSALESGDQSSAPFFQM